MLTCAGIFPGRCYPISAREITQEELKKVSDHPLHTRRLQMCRVFSFFLLCLICLTDVVFILHSFACSLAFPSMRPVCFSLFVSVFSIIEVY